MEKVFIIYDHRAIESTDEAQVFEICNSLEEAKRNANDYGGGVIYSYDDDDGTLINPKLVLIVYS